MVADKVIHVDKRKDSLVSGGCLVSRGVAWVLQYITYGLRHSNLSSRGDVFFSPLNNTFDCEFLLCAYEQLHELNVNFFVLGNR